MSFEEPTNRLKDHLFLSSIPALCFAADVRCSIELCHALDNPQCQRRIAILKVHPEIIEDWSEKTIEIVKDYARKYDFLIWADQKLCDVPHILLRQLESVAWADIVSIMSIACSTPDILRQIQEVAESKNIMVVIVNELHTEGKKMWSDSSTFEAPQKQSFLASDLEKWSDYPCVVGTVGKKIDGLCHIRAGIHPFSLLTPECDIVVRGRSLLY